MPAAIVALKVKLRSGGASGKTRCGRQQAVGLGPAQPELGAVRNRDATTTRFSPGKKKGRDIISVPIPAELTREPQGEGYHEKSGDTSGCTCNYRLFDG
jgi:hypothetical protein